MTSRIVRVLYTLAACGLAICGTISALNKAPAFTAFFAVTSVLFLTAVYRETECTEEHQTATDHTDHDDPAATQIQAWLHAVTALDTACCEHWWTSAGTDHDPTCHHHTRKGPR